MAYLAMLTNEVRNLFPVDYDSIENFIEERAKVRKDGKFGYIDQQGQTLTSFDYDYIGEFY